MIPSQLRWTKNMKKKLKPKFKVGDFIQFGGSPDLGGVPEKCIVTEVGTKYYYLCWLTDSVFWNQGAKDRGQIDSIDSTAKLLE